MQNEENTYLLAGLTLAYLTSYVQQWRPDAEALPGVCEMLNEWLHPKTALLDALEPIALASLFFGQGWSMFCATDDQGLGDAIFRDRPSFLPGLCVPQDGILENPLPELNFPAS